MAKRNGVSLAKAPGKAYDLIRDLPRHSVSLELSAIRWRGWVVTAGSCLWPSIRKEHMPFWLLGGRLRVHRMYTGNILERHPRRDETVQWEAMGTSVDLACGSSTLSGRRINPEQGSKQESINSMKRRFGAVLSESFPCGSTPSAVARRHLHEWRARHAGRRHRRPGAAQAGRLSPTRHDPLSALA